MRERKSARLLVISPGQEVLLFRFVHTDDALAGKDHWATPGGGLEQDESFRQAAIRELFEETGIEVDEVGEPVGDRRFVMRLPCRPLRSSSAAPTTGLAGYRWQPPLSVPSGGSGSALRCGRRGPWSMGLSPR